MGEEWHPAPAISSGWPITLQIGTVGAGVGIGCGVGVGFGGSATLAAVPVIGQAASGIQAGLGGISAMLGGAGATARAAVKQLAIPGLDAGFGCGVGVGYGFGAGLMLKPSAAEQLIRAGEQVVGQVTHTLSSTLQQAGIQQQTAPLRNTSMQQPNALQPSSSNNGQFSGLQHHAQQPQQLVAGPAGAAVPDISGMVGGSSGTPDSAQQLLLQQDAVVMRSLLQQQEAIRKLMKQNKQLRAVVCKLDPSAACCSSSRRTGKHGSSKGESSGTWSD